MKRVLIIRCGALGDLVYATSVIDAIQYEFGEDTIIDFVSTPGNGKIFEKDTRVNRVFLLKHKKIPLLFSRQKKEIVNFSKHTPYDILINCEFGKQFKDLIYKVNAKNKYGPLVQSIEIPNAITHAVDVMKYMFKEVVSEKTFKKSFPRLIGTSVEEIRKKYQLPQKYIIISPSNSHQKRNIINYRAWENCSWKELITKLSLEIPVVIIGNKGEDEFFNKIQPYPEEVIDLVGKTSLSDLIGIINDATALISTDTGTAHIASAVNTEVFALIGPTPEYETGPYQTPFNKVHIINKRLDCSPCYKTEVMKACRDNICMKQISVEDVYSCLKLNNIV